MVLYKNTVVTNKPYLSEEVFRSGYPGTEIATLFVGSERQKFTIPLKHICAIEHFDRALNGRFSEAQSKTVELTDEDPEAFLLFTEWLYRGFPDPAKCDRYDVVMWTKFYLMLDKWCMNDALPGVAKQISNMLTRSTQCSGFERDAAALEAILQTHCESIKTCYRLTDGHKLRMLFVHTVHIMNRYWWPRRMIGELSDTGFDADTIRYMYALRDTTDRAWVPYGPKQIAASEDEAHPCDKLLFPLLFDSEPWPVFISNLPSSWEKERIDERAYWRTFLKM